MNPLTRKVKHGANLLGFVAGRVQPALGPITAMWDITYRCNYRCLHCKRWENPDLANELPADRALALIDELADSGVIHLSLSGGEPFLRKDLFDIVRRAKSHDMQITINSNGTRIDDAMADRIVDAGIDMIYLSVDGDRAEIHDQMRRCKGSFEQVLAAAERLASRRSGSSLNVFTNTTLEPLNHRSLPGIAALCENMGLSGMTFQVAHNLEDMSFVSEESSILTSDHLAAIEDDTRLLTKKHKRLLPHPNEFFDNFRTFVSEPATLYRYRCAACYAIVQIQPDGAVFPCPVAFKQIGNLKEQSFEDIWKGAPAARLRRDIKDGKHPMCWFTCIAPLNILLHNANPMRLHRLIADPNVLYHAFRKVKG